MKTNTSAQIISFIKEKKNVRAAEIISHLGISPQAVFRQLKKLLEKGVISKYGKPPLVQYSLGAPSEISKQIILDPKQLKIIDENYQYVSPEGKILEGEAGFVAWCAKQNLHPVKTAAEYISTLKKYHKYKKRSH